MNTWQKRVVVVALLLVASGILLGFVQAGLVRYNTQQVLQYHAHRATAESSTQGGSGGLIQIAADKGYVYTRVIDAHTHFIKVATVLLLVALIYPVISLSDKRKRVLLILILVGNLVLPLGVLAEISVRGRAAQALAAAGAILIIAGCLGVFWGLLGRTTDLAGTAQEGLAK